MDYTDEQLDQPPVDDDREVAMETSSVSPVPTTQSQIMPSTVSHALSALDVNVIAAAATSPSQNKLSTSSCLCHFLSCCVISLPVVRSQSYEGYTQTFSWSQYHQDQ